MALFPVRINPKIVTNLSDSGSIVVDMAAKDDGSVCVVFINSGDLKAAISVDGTTWSVTTVSIALSTMFYIKQYRTASITVVENQFIIAFVVHSTPDPLVTSLYFNGTSWVSYGNIVLAVNLDEEVHTVEITCINGVPYYFGISLMADTTGDKRINTYYKDGTWQSISFGTYSSPSNFNAFGHGTCGISSLGSNIVAVTYDLDSSLGYNFLKSWIYNGATWSAPTNIYIGYYPSLAASSEQLGLAYSTSLANSSLGFAYSTDGSTWVTEIVDSDGDVGVYPTMLFDGTVPVIVYYDVSNDALKIAIKDGGWHVFTFDISGSISKNLVAFINNGIIHVTWITDDGSGEIYHFSFSIRQYHAYPQTGIAQRYFPNKSFGMSPLMRDAFVLNLLRRARSTTRFIHHLPGTADVYNQFAAHLPGTADVYNQFAAHLPGMASILLPITHDLPGVSSVRDGYTHDLPGVSSVYRTFDNTLPGVSSVLLPVTHHLPGVARIANDASNRYELFIGVDAEPDLTSPPTQTFTTLPYDVSLTLPGAGTQTTYHLVIQKRNRFGVVTLNNVSQKITIDSNGDEQPTPPRGPLEVAMTEVASLKAAITAQYAYAADGDDQADTWLVYITTTGIDPDPTSGGDTPVEVAMVKTEATASLAYTTASEVLATVIKVLVRTRRSGVAGADSTNTTALSLTLAGSALTAVTLTDALMGSLAPVQPE